MHCCLGAVSIQWGCNVPPVPGLGLKVEQNSPCVAISNILAPKEAHPGQPGVWDLWPLPVPRCPSRPLPLRRAAARRAWEGGRCRKGEETRTRCPAEAFTAQGPPGRWFPTHHTSTPGRALTLRWDSCSCCSRCRQPCLSQGPASALPAVPPHCLF